MSDPLPNRLEGQVTTATQANSTTAAVALASQRRWKIATAGATACATIAGSIAATVPGAQVPAGIVAGVCGALALLFSAFSGAEVDEKAITRIADQVAVTLSQRK